MAANSSVSPSRRRPLKFFGAILVLLLLVILAVGPITPAVHHPVSAWSPQYAHAIGLAMNSYAEDHNGAYPSGKSSTEVFQQLVDGGYVDDPTIFCSSAYQAAGKVAATSKKLKPENVCWDVTTPVNSSSPDALPLVFSTGYRVHYAPNGSATPLPGSKTVGIAVFYRSGMAGFKVDLQPVVFNVISSDFKPDGKKYMQLTPDGPLAP